MKTLLLYNFQKFYARSRIYCFGIQLHVQQVKNLDPKRLGLHNHIGYSYAHNPLGMSLLIQLKSINQNNIGLTTFTYIYWSIIRKLSSDHHIHGLLPLPTIQETEWVRLGSLVSI